MSSKFFIKIKEIKSLTIIKVWNSLMSINIQQQLDSYLKLKTRMKYKIVFTIDCLRQCKKPIDEIKKSIKGSNNPLKLFKIFILLHQCLFDCILEPLKTVELVSEVKSQAKPRKQFELDQFICNRIINPYALYLQKCYLAKTQGDYKNQESVQNLYKVINILNQGLSMVNVLYTFGRYYQEKYEFIADFNIVLARDFQQLYNVIKKILNNSQELSTQAKQQIILSLEDIHQKMYIVYFNNYYHSQLKSYIPAWINPQSASLKKENQFWSTCLMKIKQQNRSSRLGNKKKNYQSFFANKTSQPKPLQFKQYYHHQENVNSSCSTMISLTQTEKCKNEKSPRESEKINKRLNLLESFYKVINLIDEKTVVPNKS